jgi:hypothetical protein
MWTGARERDTSPVAAVTDGKAGARPAIAEPQWRPRVTASGGRFMFARHVVLALALAAAGSLALPVAAQTTAKPAKASPKAAKAPPAPVQVVIAAADIDQMKAANLVYYGVYDCEFNDKVNITQSATYPAYVDVTEKKNKWLMKPVLSSTGAVRLEDVGGETLMVQIATKSMLLNVKTGHRIVDDCISPKQREAIEAAKVAKTSS